MEDDNTTKILDNLISIRAAEKYGDLPKLANEVFDKTKKISELIVQYIEGCFSNENVYPENIKEVYSKAKKFIE